MAPVSNTEKGQCPGDYLLPAVYIWQPRGAGLIATSFEFTIWPPSRPTSIKKTIPPSKAISNHVS
jgi:hypothetical protein